MSAEGPLPPIRGWYSDRPGSWRSEWIATPALLAGLRLYYACEELRGAASIQVETTCDRECAATALHGVPLCAGEVGELDLSRLEGRWFRLRVSAIGELDGRVALRLRRRTAA
jgi:hypothetical protein